MMDTLHFIRPHGLLIFIPLVLWAWFWLPSQKNHQEWVALCDEHLLPYLIEENAPSKLPLYSFVIFSVIFAIAISGPAWRQLPAPVFRNINTRVILFAMGPSIYAQDLKPSRLVRARYKLIDLLKKTTEGQTGLIVYNDEPYVVAPLTEDTNTLINLVPVLEPSILPSSSPVIPPNAGIYALTQAQKLIEQANQSSGQIIVITDQDVSEGTVKYAEKLRQKNIQVSVMAVGTEEGAPIPLPNGGFLKNSTGKMMLAKLSTKNLKKLAHIGGGKFVMMTASNVDIEKLLTQKTNGQKQKSNQEATLWKDEGAWFILAMLPFAFLAFRQNFSGRLVGSV